MVLFPVILNEVNDFVCGWKYPRAGLKKKQGGLLYEISSLRPTNGKVSELTVSSLALRMTPLSLPPFLQTQK